MKILLRILLTTQLLALSACDDSTASDEIQPTVLFSFSEEVDFEFSYPSYRSSVDMRAQRYEELAQRCRNADPSCSPPAYDDAMHYIAHTRGDNCARSDFILAINRDSGFEFGTVDVVNTMAVVTVDVACPAVVGPATVEVSQWPKGEAFKNAVLIREYYEQRRSN